MTRVAVRVLSHGEGLPLPAYATECAGGADLLAAVADALTLAPGERALVPTGIAVAIPPGYEIQVILINLGQEPFTLRRGDRIAQIILAPVARIAWEPASELPATPRGAGGFGHTGLSGRKQAPERE